MSMRNFGCHGYVVKAETLAHLLPDDVQPAFANAIDAEDEDLVRELIENHLPDQYPTPEIFRLPSEGESEDIEIGPVYVHWDAEQLYERKPRAELQLLQTAGIDPALANWVVWS